VAHVLLNMLPESSRSFVGLCGTGPRHSRITMSMNIDGRILRLFKSSSPAIASIHDDNDNNNDDESAAAATSTHQSHQPTFHPISTSDRESTTYQQDETYSAQAVPLGSGTRRGSDFDILELAPDLLAARGGASVVVCWSSVLRATWSRRDFGGHE